MSKYIYMAGLLDGEGSIMLSKIHAGSNRTPVISVTSTTYEIVDWLKEYFGGSVSKHKTYQAHHKPSYSWKLTKQADVFDLLDQSLPYMLEPSKVARGKLILDEYLSVTKRNGKYNEQEKLAKADFELRFSNL